MALDIRPYIGRIDNRNILSKDLYIAPIKRICYHDKYVVIGPDICVIFLTSLVLFKILRVIALGISLKSELFLVNTY